MAEPVLRADVPGVEEFIALRIACGLSAFAPASAMRGLRHTLHAVTLRDGGRLVGMGRIVGDGGCFAHVTDIAVDPAYRGGQGARIMGALMAWAEANLPADCLISLIADPGAERLYARFGFEDRHGMSRRAGGAA